MLGLNENELISKNLIGKVYGEAELEGVDGECVLVLPCDTAGLGNAELESSHGVLKSHLFAWRPFCCTGFPASVSPDSRLENLGYVWEARRKNGARNLFRSRSSAPTASFCLCHSYPPKTWGRTKLRPLRQVHPPPEMLRNLFRAPWEPWEPAGDGCAGDLETWRRAARGERLLRETLRSKSPRAARLKV
jgi:hypothetical protein